MAAVQGTRRCAGAGNPRCRQDGCAPQFPLDDGSPPEESSVMVQPDSQERRPAASRKATPSRRVGDRAWSAVRRRFEGSLAQGLVLQLKAIDFSDQVMLFGAGMLVSLLPFLILLSAFASQRVDDDIALRLG